MLLRCLLVPMAALGLAACTEIPELEATIPDALENAAYPALIPLDDVLQQTVSPQERADEIETELAARRARLQGRAHRLNEPVIDAATQARMQDGVQQ